MARGGGSETRSDAGAGEAGLQFVAPVPTCRSVGGVSPSCWIMMKGRQEPSLLPETNSMGACAHYRPECVHG